MLVPPLIQALVSDLDPFGLSWELLALFVSFALAWLIARNFKRTFPNSFLSIAIVMPAVAALSVWGAALWLARSEPVPLLQLTQILLLTWLAVRASAGLLLHAFPHSEALNAVASVGKWVIWIVGVMALLGLLTPVLQGLSDVKLPFGKPQISLRDVMEAVLTAVVTLIAALWFSTWLEARLMGAKGIDMNHRLVLSKLLRASMLLVAVIMALGLSGIPLTALGVFSGALGVGLGLGLQRLAANYLSGFVILLDGSIKVHDTIRVDNFEGKISAIRTRYTLVRALNGRESIVPNETLVSTRVENLTLADPTTQCTLLASCAYQSDVDVALRILTSAAQKQKRVLSEPKPEACISAFAHDGFELTLLFFIADPDNGQVTLKGDIYREVWSQFQAAGIEVPYPQRVVRQLSNESTVEK
jgi:small-conductance mechanosensitive channel